MPEGWGVAAKHMPFACARDCDDHRPRAKTFEPQTAVDPQAAFAFVFYSCEIDGWTLIRAETGQHPKQMSKAFSSMASSKMLQFHVSASASLAATGGQALKLKGHIKSKGPRCNQASMPHESLASRAQRWKGLASSLQGHVARIEMCSHIILHRGPSQLLHSCSSTAQQQHDMLFPPLAHYIHPYIVISESTRQKGLPTMSISKSSEIYNDLYVSLIICCYHIKEGAIYKVEPIGN